MQLILSITCILLYLASTALVATRWFHQKGPLVTSAIYTAIAALLLHLVVIISNIWTGDGQNLSIINVTALTAWLITAVVLAVAYKSKQTFLLPLVTGFSAAVVTAASFVPGSAIMHIELQPGLILHIGLALLAYGCLSIAFLYALQLSFINKRLKQKSTIMLHTAMPPLMQVERNLFRLLILGTVLLTLSLGSGFFFLEDMFAQRQAHKTILTTIAWVMYVGFIGYHKKVGLKDTLVVFFSVIGILLLTLAYFGSRIVKEVLLIQ